MDGTLTGTTTPGQSGPGSKSNAVVLFLYQISRIGSLSQIVYGHMQVTSFETEGSYPYTMDIVCIYIYSKPHPVCGGHVLTCLYAQWEIGTDLFLCVHHIIKLIVYKESCFHYGIQLFERSTYHSYFGRKKKENIQMFHNLFVIVFLFAL